MRVLNRTEIEQLGNKLLDPFGGKNCLTPIGYDLRVGDTIYLLTSSDKKDLKPGKSVEIPPKERFAVESLEKVILDEKMFAFIFTRISLLWEGLTSLGTRIDPGFQDKLILIFSNDSSKSIRLTHGQRICNVMVFKYEDPPKDVEIRKRPFGLVIPAFPGPIRDPVNTEDVKRRYGLGIASTIEYIKPKLRNHEKRLGGLEKFRTGLISLVIGAMSTFVVSLIVWFVTH